MSPLTPLDVENLQLRAAMRGYDKQEVEQFRAQVMRTLEEYIDQIGRLRMRIGEMEAEVARYRETEDLVKNSVMLAQRTSEEIMNAAKGRAEALVSRAHNEGEGVRQQIARIQSDREQFEYEFHALLSGYLARLEQQNPRLARSPSTAPATAGPVPPTAQTALTAGVARDPLEQALAGAKTPTPAVQVQSTQPAPALASAPASAAAWNIINPQVQDSPLLPPFMQDPPPAASAGPAGSQLTAAELPSAPPRVQSLPADRPGSTFHAFSEPHWINPEGGPTAIAAGALDGNPAASTPLSAPPPSAPPAPAGAYAEGKRDDDIDDFTKALEQR